MQEIVEDAPKLVDFLGDESLAHFEGVQRLLEGEQTFRYTINPRLVRGLDYYNRTVFEWVTDELGAQGTVCGGGRYDRCSSSSAASRRRRAAGRWASSGCSNC